MEFNIGIQTKPDGELIIEDTSKDYDLYLLEGVESTSSYEYYKYFKSVTINSLYKVNVDNKVHIKDDINLHLEDIDTCLFILLDDGYYVDYHIVLPTIDWYNEITPEYKEYFSAIYIYNEGKIYKEIDSELLETSIEEIIERNVEGTTIIRCKLDIFFTGNLQKCYIGYSQKIFKDLVGRCYNNNYNDLIYKRDFIWMTLNIIDYLISLDNYSEAQRIIELFNSCNTFCKNIKTLVTNGCGCS